MTVKTYCSIIYCMVLPTSREGKACVEFLIIFIVVCLLYDGHSEVTNSRSSHSGSILGFVKAFDSLQGCVRVGIKSPIDIVRKKSRKTGIVPVYCHNIRCPEKSFRDAQKSWNSILNKFYEIL